MKDTVKSYLSQQHQNESGATYNLESIEVKLDTIPEYFNEVLEGTSSDCSIANKAVIALSFIRSMNSPNAQMRVQMTGQPYSMMNNGRMYYAEDAYADIDNLEKKLNSAKQNIVPAVANVAYVVEKFRYSGDTEDRTIKYVVVLDNDDPTKIIKDYSFYGLGIDEIAAIKYVQAHGNLKTDTFGKIVPNGWFNVERFILSDRLNGDVVSFLGINN